MRRIARIAGHREAVAMLDDFHARLGPSARPGNVQGSRGGQVGDFR